MIHIPQLPVILGPWWQACLTYPGRFPRYQIEVVERIESTPVVLKEERAVTWFPDVEKRVGLKLGCPEKTQGFIESSLSFILWHLRVYTQFSDPNHAMKGQQGPPVPWNDSHARSSRERCWGRWSLFDFFLCWSAETWNPPKKTVKNV